MVSEPSADIGYLEEVALWSQIDALSNSNGTSANGQDISYWFGPRQSGSKYKIDGYYESAIAFNPNWAKNGVALCGADAAGYLNTTSEGKSCLTVDYLGNITANSIKSNGNIEVGNGSSLLLPTSDNSSRAYMFNSIISGISVLSLNSDAGIYQAFKSDAFIGTISTPTSSTANCIKGQFQDDENYHYVCVSDNKWKRVQLQDF